MNVLIVESTHQCNCDETIAADGISRLSVLSSLANSVKGEQKKHGQLKPRAELRQGVSCGNYIKSVLEFCSGSSTTNN